MPSPGASLRVGKILSECPGYRKQRVQGSGRARQWGVFTFSCLLEMHTEAHGGLHHSFGLQLSFRLLRKAQDPWQSEEDAAKRALRRYWMLSYLDVTKKVMGISSYEQVWDPWGHLSSQPGMGLLLGTDESQRG